MVFPDLNPIMPELIMTALGLLLLVLELFVKEKSNHVLVALVGIAFIYFFLGYSTGVTFNGMFIADSYSRFFKYIFLICLTLSMLISIRYLEIEKSLYGEYYILLVFATLGMMIMASSGDLILLYLGLELMALSTYILAGFLRNNEKSTEAAIKYFLMGSFSSALLLYGITMLYGLTGTTDIKAISIYLSSNDTTQNYSILLAMVLFIVAFGFKIAAVPFHMWAPDVYEGAPTSVTAFMSVGPKAAGFAVLGRVFLTSFETVHLEWTLILSVLAILTMAAGNIIAISQTNIKRMLAYSSISHAGYALLGMVTGNAAGVSGMLNYLFIYAIMNLGAFAIIVMLHSEGFSGEDISDYKGLSKSHPVVSLIMLIFMFSLTGIPPTAGFIGKFYLFSALIDAGYVPLAIIALLFSVISAFFYLRIVMYMYMNDSDKEVSLSISPALGLVILATAIMVLYIGVFPQHFLIYAKTAILSI
ncbi:MAG: NADH-quinone oxidoreductase subunit N [Nitrospirae bacterium]|nr:NADH-quinone oxidoreductase subunit N [Nitrospirota bacterium]